MVSIDEMRNDDRFFINEYTLQYMFKRNVLKYQMVRIPVGKIHRYLDKQVYSLYKTDPYRYLDNPEDPEIKEQYEVYCNRAKGDNPDRSEELYNQLMENFGDNYDPKKGVIVIDQLNYIVEGQHRCCILLKKFGEDYPIDVLKIKYADYGVRAYVLNTVYLIKRALHIDC